MKHVITEWAIKESILDNVTFLTQKEWNGCGEKTHNDVSMVLVIDGSGIFSLLNSGCGTTEFNDPIESFGFWYERGYSWSLDPYPTSNYGYRRPDGGYTSKLSDPGWLRKVASVKAVAGHQCKDCGEQGRLEAHHRYYATVNPGYGPWECPLSVFRALCPTYHITRPVPEMRARVFLARLNQFRLSRLLDGLDNGFNRLETDSSINFIREASFHETHMDEALLFLKEGTDIYD